MDTPRVYVGTYYKYDNGSIAGAWLDIEDYSDKEEFYAACAELHSDEEDPEFMFQDWEGIPEGMIGESNISKEAFDWAALDDDDRELLAVYREHVYDDGDLEDARSAFMGRYPTAADYAQEVTEEQGNIPDHLIYYIDYEKMARDMGMDGYKFIDRNYNDVWVFTTY